MKSHKYSALDRSVKQIVKQSKREALTSLIIIALLSPSDDSLCPSAL